ncbi:hypothetical protein [Jiangella rhizosphaerae]|uniref:Uncharacterized protein n=1 Tax=Jiangella rhizosphaerae TaxID=2293569 RepID=A0A418KRP8_9ACTN|nr:hypothetical protein [Jiangella rhizosphaerae]RIQ24281.1 hypothetical protein DY240_12165 [Jiangella rhizosphaerae]
MLVLAVAAFSVAWWLGLYLAGRDPADPAMRRAGLGLVSYALALALAPFDGTVVDALGYVFAGLPALIWTGVLLALLPDGAPWRAPAERVWRWTVLPLGVAELAAAAIVGGGWEPLTAVLVLLPLAAALWLVLRARTAAGGAGGPSGSSGDSSALRQGVVVLATLLFALGAVAVLVPLGWVPDGLVLAAVGVDLVVLGVVVAVTNALEAGEALGADLRRSAVGALLAAVVFGGQVGLVALASGDDRAGGGDGAGDALRVLAFGVVGAAIAVVTLASAVQAAVDRLAFAGAPALRESRAELRDASDALPRRDERHHLDALDDDAFTRLVRDALRNYGDLGKLVSSPLLALPAVDARLGGREGHPLDRATELKALLLECIERLRPRDAEFGTSEEWRYFNALYFPYVAGIRPYRRQPDLSGLDDTSRRAFDWLRRYVPERTLYNWQNAAARVVAHDLRTRRG